MAANRLQRYAVFLSAYDYEVEYVKSEKNLADALSRLPRVTDEASSEDDCEYTYLNLIENDDTWTVDKTTLQEETKKDDDLREILNFVINGWPTACPENLKQYFLRKDQIHLDENLLMWGHRLMVPASLRKGILEELHSTHMGIVKCKSLARSYVWWPTCDKDIENFCKGCSICAKHRNEPPKSPIISWPETSTPWERIHLDFFGPVEGKMFLVVVDSYSKWIEVVYMPKITSEETVRKLREIFSRWGLPKYIVSDNGRSFMSFYFKNFLEKNGIKQIILPPYHPQSNGQAEVCVRIVKNLLIKTLEDRGNHNIFVALNKLLLYYRNTIHSYTGETPAKMFLGRDLRMRLDSIKPETRTKQKTKSRMGGQNQNHRNLKLSVNKKVLVRDYRNIKPTWVPAKIVKIHGPRNCTVVTDENLIWKRHSDQMLDYTFDSLDNQLHQPSDPNDNEKLMCAEDIELRNVVPRASTSGLNNNIDSAHTGSPEKERPLRLRKQPDWFRPS